jgi:hypothetical protein
VTVRGLFRLQSRSNARRLAGRVLIRQHPRGWEKFAEFCDAAAACLEELATALNGFEAASP